MPPLRLDLHNHSRHSPDSKLEVEALVVAAAAAGLDGMALTDHDSVAGHVELASLRTKFPKLLLIPGVEVSTREGHLLAYGVAETPPSHLPIAETVEWVRSRGGVTSVAHPFRRVHGVGGAVAAAAPVDALEVVNGHNSRGANRRAGELAARRRIGGTGGGDVHELSDAGRVWTEFPEEVRDVADALDAIRRGSTKGVGQSLSGLRRVRYELLVFSLRARRGFRGI